MGEVGLLEGHDACSADDLTREPLERAHLNVTRPQRHTRTPEQRSDSAVLSARFGMPPPNPAVSATRRSPDSSRLTVRNLGVVATSRVPASITAGRLGFVADDDGALF
jgi:hypothetical protein